MQKIDISVRVLSHNLDKLGPILSVAKLGSVSRAAKEVGLSQSALSHLISKFESSVGIKCFERKAHGLEVTEEGKSIAEFTKNLFVDLRDLVEQMSEKHREPITRLKVGTHETLAAHIWPSMIRQLNETNHNLAISIKSGRIDPLVESILNEDLDLIFSVEPKVMPKLQITPVYDGRLECFVGTEWCPPTHGKKAYRSSSSLKLEEIRQVPIFTDLEAHTRQGMSIPRSLALAGMNDLGRFEVGSFEAAINLAGMNLGIAIVPDRNARQALKEKRIRKLEITNWKDKSFLDYRICVSYLTNSSRIITCQMVTTHVKRMLASQKLSPQK